MKRLIIATFAALAITVFVNAQPAFSQEETESGTSVDANWTSTGSTIDAPTIDDSAASADKVLEIPQTACTKDGATVPCDDTTASADDSNDQAINAPQPGSPPTVYDDDTASAGSIVIIDCRRRTRLRSIDSLIIAVVGACGGVVAGNRSAVLGARCLRNLEHLVRRRSAIIDSRGVDGGAGALPIGIDARTGLGLLLR